MDVKSRFTVSPNYFASVAQRKSGRLKPGAAMARNHPDAPDSWRVVQRQNARLLPGKMQVRPLPCQPDRGISSARQNVAFARRMCAVRIRDPPPIANGDHSLTAKPRVVIAADVGSNPTAHPKQRIDSSNGRAAGSYPEGCRVGTCSIHQCPVAQRQSAAPTKRTRQFDSAPGNHCRRAPLRFAFGGNAVTPS